MRLIDAEALENDTREKVGYLYGVTKFIKIINEQPTIEAKPVVHAHWNDDGRCTNCGEHAPFFAYADDWYKTKYCHGCGALMDEKEND